MTTYAKWFSLALLTGLSFTWPVRAQETPAQSPPPPSAPEVEAPSAPAAEPTPEYNVESPTPAPAAPQPDEGAGDDDFGWEMDGERHHAIVRFGGDARLAAGATADAVVSIFGSSTSAGEVREAVVSIFGDTKVTGPVHQDAVAVFGDTYVDSHVGGDAVAVFGNLTLGPNAQVMGEISAVGGTINRDPNARTHGAMSEVDFDSSWIRPWFQHAALYARPLAFTPELGWAWSVAFAFLALYVLLALLFGDAIQRCAENLEQDPGRSILAAFIAMVLTPVAFILLFVSIVGILLVPFLAVAFFCIGLFGKAVMLAALGRRLTRMIDSTLLNHVAITVLIGGLLVLLLYTVPILGFIVFVLLGILGMGVVLYTALLAIRSRNGEPALAGAGPNPPGSMGFGTGSASTAPNVDPVTGATGEPIGAQFADASAVQGSPTVVAASLPRAGFWVRMLALLIDLILVSIIANVVFDSAEGLLVAIAAYGALMWKLRGTTVGGIICNVQVVRADGREVDWATAVVRALGCFLSLVIAGLGFIWIAFDPEHQAWHDKIAGTVVVRVPKGKSLV